MPAATATLAACLAALPPAECCVEDTTPEAEACGEDSNGGCGRQKFAADGDDYCGTAWADGGTRDTDWYRVSVPAGATLHGRLWSQFDGVVYVLDGAELCAPVIIGEPGSSAGCMPGEASAADLEARDYIIFVATSGFDGVPCGSGLNQYRLRIALGPCVGDTNEDDLVDVNDLINVITLWGTSGDQPPGIDADVVDDDIVNVADLVLVILSWGPC